MRERKRRDRTPPDERTDCREREKLPEPPPFDPDMSLIGDMEKLQRPLRRDKNDADR